jgi:plasmid maintenance system antidote protein VapI
MKIINRVAKLIEIKGISMTEFDKRISASNGYIGKLIRTNGSIGSDMIEKIFSVFPDINPEWLILGEGSMLKSKTTDQVFKNTYDPYNNFNKENPCLKCEALADRDKKIHELQTKLIECQERIINLINNQKL